MPAPEAALIATPSRTTIRFSLEPALNGFHSLMLLIKADHLYGLDEWVTRTAASLPKEVLHTHQIVFNGLYHAVEPVRSHPTFPAYIDDLAAQDPTVLRDRLFEAYARVPLLADKAEGKRATAVPLRDTSYLLASKKAFLGYLRERFSPDHVDEEIETEAHGLLQNPPKMQALIVSHLKQMWSEVLEPEWKRVTPMLQACINAYRQIDFSGMSHLDAAQRVIGHEINEWLQASVEQAERVVFVPSAHAGPYVGKLMSKQTLWLFFGARQPDGVPSTSPDLSRSELLVRMMALADDTRLRILHLLAEHGELCSPDIIRLLDLSQSAASRHLQQLGATGYIKERRRDGAKCYSLSVDRIDDTFRALARFLQAKGSSAGSSIES
jgi:DNA-binding transcriptional ArsR family regulator